MPYSNPVQRKKYHKEYMKRWIVKNQDKWRAIVEKSESRPERKAYQTKWQRTNPKFKLIQHRYNTSDKGKAYQKQWRTKNLERAKQKDKKYYYTPKGTANFLRKRDKKKFNDNSKISEELILEVDERDITCVYCHKKLLKGEIEYDHLNPFIPFSNINMVRCCSSCNQSKNNSNVIDWCKFKGYFPSQIVLDLLEKQSLFK